MSATAFPSLIRRVARPGDRLLRYLLVPLVLPLLFIAALFARVVTAAYRTAGKRPRNMWGPVPLVSNIYAAKAIRRHSYRSASVVCEGDRIAGPEKFDLYLPTVVPSGTLKDILR